MYREVAAHSEVHVSHFMSKRFRPKREDRIRSFMHDLGMTSKIEMRYNESKGVQ